MITTRCARRPRATLRSADTHVTATLTEAASSSGGRCARVARNLRVRSGRIGTRS